MGLFNTLFQNKKESNSIQTEKNTIYAPVSGDVISLNEIGDGVFSEGILGNGCGIKPNTESVVAPFHGKIIQVADTKHAVGICSEDGIELLIHVGLDTVSMNGKGFHVAVEEGDSVRCGDTLFTFERSAIAAAGYPDTVVIVVTNTSDYNNIELCASAKIEQTEKLMVVK